VAIFLITLACIALAIHMTRQYWANRDLPQVSSSEFQGELFVTGQTYIARRAARNASQQTVICFPGFLEDMRYFQALHEDTDCELILVNNANYHCPFPALDAYSLSWADNPYTMGTIEHDGFVLAQALQHLTTGKRCVLHGHSRGGAVVLEAGRQFPELMQREDVSISAILEAPVVPRGRSVGKANDPVPHRIISYLLPLVMALLRNSSEERFLKQPMMRPTNPLKTKTVQTIYSTARNYGTCVTNVQSIVQWQANAPMEVYENFRQLTVVIGARDDVLDNPSMLESAREGARRNAGVSVLQTENTNHFVTLEEPHYIKTLLG